MIVKTTKGDMDASLLERREGRDENANEIAKWTEYWLHGELVHRSAHVEIKRFPAMTGVVQDIK